MPRKVAAEDEFVVSDNSVTHVPLNAIFMAYPDRPEIDSYLAGDLGNVLPNGDDYDEESVITIATRLMRDRNKK